MGLGSLWELRVIVLKAEVTVINICTDPLILQGDPEAQEHKESLSGVSKKAGSGNSLVVQWLGLGVFTAVGLDSIPGRGTKIPDRKSTRLNSSH